MSSLSFTLIQSELHWEDKAANLKMFEEKIKSITDKTEVVILPEMFSTGFTMQPAPLAETMDGPTVEWMKGIAAKHKIILVGSIIISSSPATLRQAQGDILQAQGDKPQTQSELVETQFFYNRLIWMLPNGQYGFYDKRHLFAFAGEHERYTAGNKRLVASVKGWKINLQVCYDLRFPVWARQSTAQAPTGEDANPEYDILIYVANWPQARSHAWKTLLQARAIENQCYVIGVNRVGSDGNGIAHNGDSMVIDPLGELLYHKPGEEDTFTITLEKQPLEEARKRFPFLKDADGFRIS